jgi:hypothetical protein
MYHCDLHPFSPIPRKFKLTLLRGSRVPYAALNAGEQDSQNCNKRLKRYWIEEKTEAEARSPTAGAPKD